MRQLFLRRLTDQYGYPKERIFVEKGVTSGRPSPRRGLT